MISVILIDDEKTAIEVLELIIKKHCPHLKILGYAHNIHDGYQLIESLKPDLIFLDINMPGGLGLELVEKITHLQTSVIFTTAYQEYAINAVKLAAVDYLLKPMDAGQVIDAVKAYEERTKSFANLSVLRDLLATPQKLERLAIPNQQGIEIIKRAEISFIEASRNYSIFYLLNDQKLVASKPLAEYSRLLEEHGFTRVHRSFLVNLEHVQKFNKSSGTLLMIDGKEIEVARNRKEDILLILSKSA